MRTALVTGSAGFVGGHMVAALQKRGYLTYEVDIKNGDDARDYFKTADRVFDLVVHLAAVVGGRLTIEGSPLSVAVDLSIDAEMFGWAVRTRQPRVIYYSSSAAYPIELQTRELYSDLTEADIDLNDVRTPDLTYGWAKLTGEFLAQYAEREGVRVHVFRPFSGYGTDQALDYPFPSFVHRARRRLMPFDVWGDGTQVRDFIHIDDVVEATLVSVEQDYREPLNLGTGRATSFNQLADMCMEAGGYQAPIQHIETAPTGVHYRVADVENMCAVYTPRVTLEEGIWRAIRLL